MLKEFHLLWEIPLCPVLQHQSFHPFEDESIKPSSKLTCPLHLICDLKDTYTHKWNLLELQLRSAFKMLKMNNSNILSDFQAIYNYSLSYNKYRCIGSFFLKRELVD